MFDITPGFTKAIHVCTRVKKNEIVKHLKSDELRNANLVHMCILLACFNDPYGTGTLIFLSKPRINNTLSRRFIFVKRTERKRYSKMNGDQKITLNVRLWAIRLSDRCIRSSLGLGILKAENVVKTKNNENVLKNYFSKHFYTTFSYVKYTCCMIRKIIK